MFLFCHTADNFSDTVCRMEGTEVKQLTVQPTTSGGRGMFLNMTGKRRGEPDQKVNVKIDSAEIEVLKALLQVWLPGCHADAWCLPPPTATVESGVMAAGTPGVFSIETCAAATVGVLLLLLCQDCPMLLPCAVCNP